MSNSTPLEAMLWKAADDGDLGGVVLYLSRGADPTSRWSHGSTPMLAAARAGHRDCALWLSNKDGAWLACPESGLGPCCLAASFGHRALGLELAKAWERHAKACDAENFGAQAGRAAGVLDWGLAAELARACAGMMQFEDKSWAAMAMAPAAICDAGRRFAWDPRAAMAGVGLAGAPDEVSYFEAWREKLVDAGRAGRALFESSQIDGEVPVNAQPVLLRSRVRLRI